jgi:hypothetical protein
MKFFTSSALGCYLALSLLFKMLDAGSWVRTTSFCGWPLLVPWELCSLHCLFSSLFGREVWTWAGSSVQFGGGSEAAVGRARLRLVHVQRPGGPSQMPHAPCSEPRGSLYSLPPPPPSGRHSKSHMAVTLPGDFSLFFKLALHFYYCHERKCGTERQYLNQAKGPKFYFICSFN